MHNSMAYSITFSVIIGLTNTLISATVLPTKVSPEITTSELIVSYTYQAIVANNISIKRFQKLSQYLAIRSQIVLILACYCM